MITLRNEDRDKIIKEIVGVLELGFGRVEITIQDFKILDIIPSPRIRIKEELKRTTQSSSSYELQI